MAIKITSTEEFNNLIATSDKEVIVDFYADWCGPCKMLAPILEEIADEKADKLVLAKVNVDELMDLAVQFKVSSIPMVASFKNGKQVGQFVGYIPKNQVEAWIES